MDLESKRRHGEQRYVTCRVREFATFWMGGEVLYPAKRLVCALALMVGSPLCASELSPFESDGCSAFPNGTLQQQELWLGCCHAHDLAYWRGGTYSEREAADLELQECVASVGEPEIAALMLAGVRVGGTPYLPTQFRWGYGWPYERKYGDLTDAEHALADRLLAEYEESGTPGACTSVGLSGDKPR